MSGWTDFVTDEQFDTATARANQAPDWVRPNALGMVDVSLDEENSKRLDRDYSRQTAAAIKGQQGPTPQEQAQEAMRLIARESAQDRIPDPDYDIMPRASDAYAKVDTGALAMQRARDYADDLEQELKTKGESYSEAERERIIANRQAEELKRLESAPNDEERSRARDERRMRMLLGKTKLRAGSSLLSDEQTGSGSTLLTG